MWWILEMLSRFTHQVAVCFFSSDITHCPAQTLRFDLNPSTALLAWMICTPPKFPVYGYCWYAGLFFAILSIGRNNYLHDTESVDMSKKFFSDNKHFSLFLIFHLTVWVCSFLIDILKRVNFHTIKKNFLFYCNTN